jgi:uncharacterized alkaline shock family protein YloU
LTEFFIKGSRDIPRTERSIYKGGFYTHLISWGKTNTEGRVITLLAKDSIAVKVYIIVHYLYPIRNKKKKRKK